MVCQHNGQLQSERAERYEMDEASDSGECSKPAASETLPSNTTGTTTRAFVALFSSF